MPLPSPGSSGIHEGRRLFRQGFLAVALVLCLLALLHSLRHQKQQQQDPPQAPLYEAPQVEERELEEYDAIIFVTHPKTGTAAALCMVEALQLYLRRHCRHSVMTSYVSENLTGPTIGYYMHLAKSVAVEQFHEAKAPYLILRTGSAPFEVCYDSSRRVEESAALLHTPVHTSAPGRQCESECPCEGNRTQCLSLGHCFSSEPFSRILWVHVIRHPVDVVLSLYNYHTRDPPAEPWLEEVGAVHYAAYLADNGVDNSTFEQLGVYSNDSLTYWEFLQNSSLAHGLQTEFLRSSPGLWKMARLHHRLSGLPGRSIRIQFEDLMTSPIDAWQPLLSAIKTPCMERNTSGFYSYLHKKCGADTWLGSGTGPGDAPTPPPGKGNATGRADTTNSSAPGAEKGGKSGAKGAGASPGAGGQGQRGAVGAQRGEGVTKAGAAASRGGLGEPTANRSGGNSSAGRTQGPGLPRSLGLSCWLTGGGTPSIPRLACNDSFPLEASVICTAASAPGVTAGAKGAAANRTELACSPAGSKAPPPSLTITSRAAPTSNPSDPTSSPQTNSSKVSTITCSALVNEARRATSFDCRAALPNPANTTDLLNCTAAAAAPPLPANLTCRASVAPGSQATMLVCSETTVGANGTAANASSPSAPRGGAPGASPDSNSNSNTSLKSAALQGKGAGDGGASGAAAAAADSAVGEGQAPTLLTCRLAPAQSAGGDRAGGTLLKCMAVPFVPSNLPSTPGGTNASSPRPINATNATNTINATNATLPANATNVAASPGVRAPGRVGGGSAAQQAQATGTVGRALPHLTHPAFYICHSSVTKVADGALFACTGAPAPFPTTPPPGPGCVPSRPALNASSPPCTPRLPGSAGAGKANCTPSAPGAGESSGRSTGHGVGASTSAPPAPDAPSVDALKAAQVASMLSDPYVRHQMCQLERLLGYRTYASLCSRYRVGDPDDANEGGRRPERFARLRTDRTGGT